ncbi:MAG TPA: DUF1566 domain-containing protein [bacterium]|nr:DUF1566 domain-containing protein [bacterium]
MKKVLFLLMFAVIFMVVSCELFELGNKNISCLAENEERVVRCAKDIEKEQKQICLNGEWTDKGYCYLCEENETRIITCGTDIEKEQDQICSNGEWVDKGFCYLCEESEKRTIPCETNETMILNQTCILGDWYDDGKCRCSADDVFCHEKHGFWSDISNDTMNWEDALVYCENLGGQLPSISELRGLIIACSGTIFDGECEVTDDCLSYNDCWNSACKGCENNNYLEHSIFDDIENLWSFSELSDTTDYAWYVYFKNGSVNQSIKASKHYVRCVK